MLETLATVVFFEKKISVIFLFFQTVVVSVPLYGCTICTQRKPLEKKLDGNNARMLCAILYGHIPPILQTIQVRRARHAKHSLPKFS